AANGLRAEQWMDADEHVGEVARTESKTAPTRTSDGGTGRRWRRIARAVLVVLLLLVAGYSALRFDGRNWRNWRTLLAPQTIATAPDAGDLIVVTPSESIATALASSPPGASVLVEPG